LINCGKNKQRIRLSIYLLLLSSKNLNRSRKICLTQQRKTIYFLILQFLNTDGFFRTWSFWGLAPKSNEGLKFLTQTLLNRKASHYTSNAWVERAEYSMLLCKTSKELGSGKSWRCIQFHVILSNFHSRPKIKKHAKKSPAKKKITW